MLVRNSSQENMQRATWYLPLTACKPPESNPPVMTGSMTDAKTTETFLTKLFEIIDSAFAADGFRRCPPLLSIFALQIVLFDGPGLFTASLLTM
jgi:hypothetical protein